MEDKTRSRGRQEEDNRRTRSGDRLAAVAGLHSRKTRRGQQAEKKSNAPDTAFTSAARGCGQLLFHKGAPQQ